MRPFFRHLLTKVLGLRAAMAAGTAVTLTDIASSASFVGIVALLLASEAWIQSRGSNNSKEIALCLKRLSEQYGSIEEALEKLANESESHSLIDPAWASKILDLVHATNQRIEEMHLDHTSALNKAVEFLSDQVQQHGDRTQLLLQSIEDEVLPSLSRIESSLEEKQDTAERRDNYLQNMDARLANIEQAVVDEPLDEEIDDAAEMLRQHKHSDAIVLLNRLRQRRWARLSSRAKYRVLANLGIAHHAMDDDANAAKFFLEALQYRPHHKQARCFDAIARSLEGDRDKAYARANEITREFPDYGLGWAIWIRSAPDEMSYDEIVLKLDDKVLGDADVQVALSQYALYANRIKEAELHARRALAACPDSPEVFSLLGTAILTRIAIPLHDRLALYPAPRHYSAISESIRLLDQAIEGLEPYASKERLAGLELNRAIGYGYLRNPKEAERAIEHAHEIDPSLAPATIRYANLLGSRGKTEEAIRALRDVSEPTKTTDVDIALSRFLIDKHDKSSTVEAADILHAHLEDVSSMPRDLRGQVIGILFEAYVRCDRLDAAEKLLAKSAEYGLSAGMVAMMRAFASRSAGDVEAARLRLKEAFSQREGLSRPDELGQLAQELQLSAAYPEALTVWQGIVEPDSFGPHTLHFLQAAVRTGHDRLALNFCRKLRANEFEEPDCVLLEASILSRYGEYEAVIRLLQDHIQSTTDEEFKKELRLRLSMRALESNRPELIEQDPTKLPSPATLHPANVSAMVHVLHRSNTPENAAAFAYDALREHWSDKNAHKAMIHAVFFPPGVELQLDAGDTVQPGLAAHYRECGRKDVQEKFFILEDAENPQFDRRELDPENLIAKELIGKSVGEEFILNPRGYQKHKAVVVRITNKCVARANQCMSDWEARFPDEFFVSAVPLQESADGKFDISPILKSIDERARAGEHVENIYRKNWVPLHVFAHAMGKNVLEASLHVSTAKQLQMRCCSGSTEDLRKAHNFLEDAPAIVADITALATVLANEAWGLITAASQVIVAQASLNSLRRLREQMARNSSGGSMAKIDGNYVFASYEDKEFRHQNTLALARFDKLIKIVEESCDVQSGLPLADWDKAKREETIKFFGEETAQSIAIAAEHGVPLWADDHTIALISCEQNCVDRVWTYAVADWLACANRIEHEYFHDITLRLLESGYVFTPISADLLLHATSRSDWQPNRAPLSSVLEHMSRPEVNAVTLFGVLGKSIALLWKHQTVGGQASRVQFAILERVGTRPRGTVMLNALQSQMDRFFDGNLEGCTHARHAILHWLANFK